MSNPMAPQNTAEKNAQKYFRKAEQADTLAKQSRKTERNVAAVKTAKLRGLRLAKELADKEAAERQTAEDSANNTGVRLQTRPKRALKAKPAAMVRMSY